jgi:hypothetical protein
MKRLTGLPIIGFLTILSGCYSSGFLEYEGLKPASLAISKSIQSMVVVSRCDLDSSYKIAAFDAGRGADFTRDSVMMKQAVLGCSDVLVESPRFKLFNPVVTRNLSGFYTEPTIKIPWTKIMEISGEPARDAVLCMDYGTVDDTIRSDPDNWFMPYQYIVIVKTHWRLYRLADFQSTDFNYSDTIAFDIDSPTEFLSSVNQGPDFLKDALYQAGVATARRLAPWWTTFRRYYFGSGPQGMQTAAIYLTDGKWKEAAEILRPLTESKTKFLARNATFNMALTCELANNIPAALDWLAKSEKLGVHQLYITEYRAQLAKRKTELENLDLQMK